MQGVKEAKCFFCKTAVDPEDNFCFGCGEFICDDMDCDGNRNRNMPLAKHDVSLHAESDEEDED